MRGRALSKSRQIDNGFVWQLGVEMGSFASIKAIKTISTLHYVRDPINTSRFSAVKVCLAFPCPRVPRDEICTCLFDVSIPGRRKSHPSPAPWARGGIVLAASRACAAQGCCLGKVGMGSAGACDERSCQASRGAESRAEIRRAVA